MGFFVVVLKFVLKYNFKGDYEMSRCMLRVGMLVMFVIGMIVFLIFYILVLFFVEIFFGGMSNNGFMIDYVVYVIWMVSLVFLVVLIMSFVCGFF